VDNNLYLHQLHYYSKSRPIANIIAGDTINNAMLTMLTWCRFIDFYSYCIHET